MEQRLPRRRKRLRERSRHSPNAVRREVALRHSESAYDIDESENMHTPDTIVAVVKIALLLGGLMTAAAYLVLLERWIAAWVQDRLGPNRVGIPLTKIRLFGLGQPLADGLKFIFKEDYTPAHVDKVLFTLAPIVDSHRRAGHLRRDSVRQRAAADRDRRHDAADRVGRRAAFGRRPDLCLRPVEHRRLWRDPRRLGQQQQIQLSRRAALQRPVDRLRNSAGAGHPGRGAVQRLAAARQDHHRSGGQRRVERRSRSRWGCVVFAVASFAEAARLPFDLPEAEQELVGGYHTEYAGMRLLLFLIAEFLHMVTAAFLIVILFFGGWHLWGLTGSSDDVDLADGHLADCRAGRQSVGGDRVLHDGALELAAVSLRPVDVAGLESDAAAGAGESGGCGGDDANIGGSELLVPAIASWVVSIVACVVAGMTVPLSADDRPSRIARRWRSDNRPRLNLMRRQFDVP